MRLAIEPFRPAHLAAIVVQSRQLPDLAALPGKLGALAEAGPSFTAFADPLDGRDYVAGIARAQAAATMRDSGIDGGGDAVPARSRIDDGDCEDLRRVVCCAGLAVNHPGYASAWALFAEGIGLRTWGELIAATRRILDASGYRRIDMLVRADFDGARAYAECLGFTFCGLFRCFGEDGSDYAVFERIS